jgi:hypothetical protein
LSEKNGFWDNPYQFIRRSLKFIAKIQKKTM